LDFCEIYRVLTFVIVTTELTEKGQTLATETYGVFNVEIPSCVSLGFIVNDLSLNYDLLEFCFTGNS